MDHDDPHSNTIIPNNILINECQPGQLILYHNNGPKYKHKTATINDDKKINKNKTVLSKKVLIIILKKF